METLWQDIRYGLRQLRKNPGFTAVAVLTLALGIGANTAIFSVINGVLLQPMPFAEQDRIVTLWEKTRDGDRRNVGYTTVVDWRAESKTLEHLAAYRWWEPSLTGEGNPEQIQGLRVSYNFFSVLGVTPALGRNFLPEEDRPENNRVVILSHGLWQRRFAGDPEIVGKPVTLSDRSYLVVGVLPEDFDPVVSNFAYEPAEAWSPLAYDVSFSWACRTCRHIRAIGRLAADASLDQAQAEISTITDRLKRDFPDDYSGKGVALVRLHDRVVGSVRPALLILFGAVGFVLLIACANVANLSLARAANRAKEFSIRSALGAGRGRILRQLLTESVLLAMAGGVAGLLLALWGVDALLALSPSNLPRLEEVRVQGGVLSFVFVVSLLTGVLFGLAPALQLIKSDVNETLKQGGRGFHAGSHRLRSLLIVGETALALILLIGGALLLNSFVQLSRVNPGFDTRNVLTFTLSVNGAKYDDYGQLLSLYRQARERLAALPGVESVSWVSNLPLRGNYDRYGMPIEDRPEIPPTERPSVERYGVGPGYLGTMRIPLIRGRDFTEQDNETAPLVALINQTLAHRLWPDENPIGKRIRMGGGQDAWRTIVGIVGDVRHDGLAFEPAMQAYVPYSQANIGRSDEFVLRTSVDPLSLIDAVRNEVWAVDPDQPVYSFFSMEQLAASTIAQQHFTMLMLGVFATMALALASIGLYGVISYSVAQRINEIGIRMALGAQTGAIFKMVLQEGLWLALTGLALGAAGAFALTRLLKGMLYGVTATDPTTFVAVAWLMLGVALLACYIPARRATKVDPMVALRHE